MIHFTQCIDGDDLNKMNEIDIFEDTFEFRFGDEFCFKKCISDDNLEKAISLSRKYDKRISFIYPRLNEDEMNQVKGQLYKINKYDLPIHIIANDMGIVQVIKAASLNNLRVILGRQTISVPMRARPAMPSVMGKDNVISHFADKKLFHLTNVNYKLTLNFLKNNHIYGLEFDYIPETFPLIKKLQKEGFYTYIHNGNVMVALTRKCHTKRMVCKDAANCKSICRNRKFRLSHQVTDELFLDGNAILAMVPVKEEDMQLLEPERLSIVNSHIWIKKDNE